MASENIGRVIQVIGPVVDIEFPKGVPAVYNAVNIEGGNIRVVVEVEQHLGENRVRCVAMQPTDGMVRGMAAKDTGAAIQVPVGVGTLGRVLNVLGEPVDEFGPVKSEKRYPIHRNAPAFDGFPLYRGPAFLEKPFRHFAPGATGAMVPTLTRWILGLAG